MFEGFDEAKSIEARKQWALKETKRKRSDWKKISKKRNLKVAESLRKKQRVIEDSMVPAEVKVDENGDESSLVQVPRDDDAGDEVDMERQVNEPILRGGQISFHKRKVRTMSRYVDSLNKE